MQPAPGKDELLGNPVPTRRRRCQPRGRKAFLDDPQFLRIRPAATAARIDNVKATDPMTVSKDIHTDYQLSPDDSRKTVQAGGILLLIPKAEMFLCSRGLRWPFWRAGSDSLA